MQAGVWCENFARGRVRGASRLTHGIGRSVISVAIRARCMMDGVNPNIKWCPDCGRYYNTTAAHECFGREINQNREKLERWLGTFTIKEDN